MSVRAGAVDIGTNSTRLLVADVEGGRLREVERLLTITRLGDGVDASARLNDAAIARVRAALDRYRDVAERTGARLVLATATSAVRDAANGREFLEDVEQRYGFRTRLLTGAEEAATTFRGVTSSHPAGPGTLVCDIGGGSTELVLGGPGGVEESTSLDMGCVRMSERFLPDDPPTQEQLEALRAAAAALVPVPLAERASNLVGVAGTITTLATIDLDLEREVPELVDGHELRRERVEEELARLAAMRLEERRHVRGLLPERAPTIVAGAAILAGILDVTAQASLTVSERDILHGIALEAATLA